MKVSPQQAALNARLQQQVKDMETKVEAGTIEVAKVKLDRRFLQERVATLEESNKTSSNDFKNQLQSYLSDKQLL